jgi:hypothetical protein
MDIKKILEDHKLWLETGGKEGKRAYLRGADLSEADLQRANFSDADLQRADLRRANLSDADLDEAYLIGADLVDADLRGAYLRRANLNGADFRGAYLIGADLRGADLRGADLRGAYLLRAYLNGADLSDANLPNFQICPEEGSFIGWKKTTTGIAKLKIPHDSKRTSSLVGRKCRAEFVDVLEAPKCAESICTCIRINYIPGQRVYADSYNTDIKIECTHGIHFFMTRKEAEEF